MNFYILFLLIFSSFSAVASQCGVKSANLFNELKKIRIVEVENVSRNKMGYIINGDVTKASVGWHFNSNIKFKSFKSYKPQCCEFRQYLSAYWIKDGKRDLGDGENGFSQTNIDFRENLKHWPVQVDDTGGAYGHRSKIVPGDKWQNYSHNGYFMKDEPGTGGAKKSHLIKFHFKQKIIDICQNKTVLEKEKLLVDKWDYISIESAHIIRDLDDD
jgi:hypothetical protein